MRRAMCSVMGGLVLLSASAITDRSALAADSRSTRACDLAAASPEDGARPPGIAGVDLGKIDAKSALPICQTALASDRQNPRLLFQVGRIFDGMRAYRTARSYYEKAAKQDYAIAQDALGHFYAQGRGGLAQSDEEAARLFKLAADQGNSDGQVDLGFFYETGRGGLAKSDAQARRLYMLAADQGNKYAQADLGVFYRDGRGGLAKNDRQAARFFKLAADQGNAGAEVNLGFFYDKGRGGLAKNDQEAARLFRLAADQGNSAAQVNLGFFYKEGRGGLPRNDAQAAHFYKLAAEQGNAAAQDYLGRFHRDGRGGLAKSDAEAARLFTLAADQGNSDGEADLGMFYEQGRGGLPKNDAKAARLYKLAAEQGNAAAENALARFYRDGRGGLPVSDAEAAGLFKRAAGDGNAAAENSLGLLYEEGRGVTQDDAQALSWFRKAAAQGFAEAENNIGAMYEHGLGVAQDNAQAVLWYRKAADRGDPTALANWRRLAKTPLRTPSAKSAAKSNHPAPLSTPAYASVTAPGVGKNSPTPNSNRARLSWQAYDHEDPSSAQVTHEVASQVTFSNGTTLQAFGKCGATGLYISFGAFRGGHLTPLPYAWENNEISISMRIDGRVRPDVRRYTRNPAANQVTIGFVDPTARERYFMNRASFMANAAAHTRHSSGWKNFVAGTAGTLKEFVAAQSVRAEFPLADGSTDVAEINPRDPLLKALARRCESSLQH